MIASFRDRIAAVIGNLLEHYDKFLFGLIAPFIAPLFFEESDPVVALLCTYGMLPLGFLMRPLGAIYFGWIGERYCGEWLLLRWEWVVFRFTEI
jgi:MHS family proline/betaine transporter-like MFS transporter